VEEKAKTKSVPKAVDAIDEGMLQSIVVKDKRTQRFR
jgi:hypothetical protein